jgi:catechol 2,3-dioxygenase-like lactoylglutathione lyase family enzyme
MADHAEQTTSKAIIVAAEPELFVANIEASLDFFTRKLGFAKAFTYGEPPRNEIRCRVNRDLRFRRGELHCLVRESFEQLDLLEAERSRRSAGYDQDPEGRARVHQRHGHDGPVVARLLRLSL